MEISEENMLRNAIHEMIIRLMKANKLNSLELIQMHVKSAIKEIEK